MKTRTAVILGGVGLALLWFWNSNSDVAQSARGGLAGWVSDKWNSNFTMS